VFLWTLDRVRDHTTRHALLAPPPYFHTFSDENPDPGSGAFLIRNKPIPDPGSQTYIFELNDNFLGKKIYNSLKIGLKIFLRQFKNKIIFNCVIFVATKKQFFHPSLLLLFLDQGSEINKNQG
jgi:hypothetical protein